MRGLPRLSRRALLGAGAGAGAAGLAAAGTALALHDDPVPAAARPRPAYPFHGEHQSGILTPAQDRLHFAAFDVAPTATRDDVVALLRAWSTAAAAMTAGRPVGAPTQRYDAPPEDTGEALDLGPAGLTVTVGVGRGLFVDADGRDRFGLADRLPAGLEPLPHFPGDALDPARSDGDLCVQACADDPQVAVHAVRNLARLALGTASVRWAQLGYGRTSSTSSARTTPRNLFGFKDGTASITAEQADDVRRHVWVAPGDDDAADWLAGGSYLVCRRIAMRIEQWDRASLREQESVIGRDRRAGAPLSGGTETTPVDLAAAGGDGRPLVPPTSHVAVAHPDANDGVRLLRRGYTYTDGADALGRLDAGLFFIAFVRDPRTHFTPMQLRLARHDAMSEYVQHTGSAVFAVPPGAREGGFVGEPLLA